jgi:circadian clock protein KaiB
MKSPGLSRIDQIIAVPKVVRHLPLPERRVMGTLSDTAAAMSAMGMRP